MKLNEYSISFPDYPWIEPVAPFRNWDRSNPTGSLQWYEAYNRTKHDRESHLKKATLSFAFDAVAACAIMIVGQFGEVFGFDLRTSGRPRTFFWIVAVPFGMWRIITLRSSKAATSNGCPSTIPFRPDD